MLYNFLPWVDVKINYYQIDIVIGSDTDIDLDIYIEIQI